MVRVPRIVAALALAFAVGGVPLVADWCAATCEAAHERGTPSCHHASSAGAHLGHLPAPCGHDHHPIIVDAATTIWTTARAADVPAVAIDSDVPAAAARVVIAHTPNPPADRVSPSLPLSITLRI